MSWAAFTNRLNRAGARFSEADLINFDYKVIAFSLLVLALFLLSVTFKLNYSSIDFWNVIVPPDQGEQTGLTVGDPKAIRSDEWMVNTPLSLSQQLLDFPVQNDNIGANADPLLMSLPVRHFSTIFRPQNWGYFLLDAERGFSYAWNFKAFGLFVSFFFLLLLVTRNNFGLSLLGSFWLFFSGFIQWWFSTNMPDMLTSSFVATVALVYLFVSRRRLSVLISLLLLILFGVNFILFFYPPFQVPLAYLMLFLLAGLLFAKPRRAALRQNLRPRLALLAGTGLVMAAPLYFFYLDARSTVDAIAATVYPGRRISLGGDVTLARLFSGFSRIPLSEREYPAIWSNACEASNFILLFPVVLAAAGRNFILKVKNSPMVVSLSLYACAISAWILVTFPTPLAKLSLMSFVPPNRALLGLGIASIVLVVAFLSETVRRNERDRSFTWAVTVLSFLALILFGLLLRREVGGFFRYRDLLIVATAFTVAAWLIINKKRLWFAVAVALMLTPYYLVNPIAAGLDPFYDKEASRYLAQKRVQEPSANWAVFGSVTLANFIKASGLNVVNGTKYTPDFDLYRVLDPEEKQQAIYNRYAHITLSEPAAAAPADANFTLVAGDAFIISIDPCAPQLAQLGIDNFVFDYSADMEKLSCLTPAAAFERNGIWLYQRKTD